jgi:uncharacterized protein
MHSDMFLMKLLAKTYDLVIVQPATLCNIDCSYCYLPSRDRQKVMSDDVAIAIAEGIAAQDAPHKVTVGWHGGEPLTTGVGRFERLLAAFETLREEGKVTHAVQTNATLINDAWCELFDRFQIGIGVSIDGPPALNTNRRDRRGNETFDRAMRGIARLKAAGIEFNVIAVVSPETIDRPDELLAFFDELSPMSLGINIEERENANAERPVVSSEPAEAFWRKAIAHLRTDSELRLRELTHLATYLAIRRGAADIKLSRQLLPTISWDGNVVVLSPELAGATAPQYANFIVGNVLRTPLAEILAQVDQVQYVQEFSAGLANCKASCSMWDFCRGADASNRFFEHGDFTVTATAHCRNRVQALVNALLSATRAEPTTPAKESIEGRLAELAGDPD